jgi:hypothetical protein
MIQAGANSQSELFLEYALRMTKGRLKLVGLTSAILLILAVAAVLLLSVVVADHLAPGDKEHGPGLGALTPSLLRWGSVLAVGVLTIYAVAGPMLRHINNVYVARLIEKAQATRLKRVPHLRAVREGVSSMPLLKRDRTPQVTVCTPWEYQGVAPGLENRWSRSIGDIKELP